MTVKLEEQGFSETKFYTGKVVSSDVPFREIGKYWGY